MAIPREHIGDRIESAPIKMATCGNDVLEQNRQKITWIYETVLDHTYKGKLKNTSNGTDPSKFGKWMNVRSTYLVYKVDGENPKIIKNIPASEFDYGEHAEAQLIEELIKKGKKKKTNDSSSPESEVTDLFSEMSVDKTEITIYINNSPCSQIHHECTSKLIKYLDSNVNVRLILYVATLYNICRESCKGEFHISTIDPETHEKNYRGLRNLMQHNRCDIKAFTEDIWKELFRMTTESDELPDDYDKITDGNERSRKDEDERIRIDLNHIRNNTL